MLNFSWQVLQLTPYTLWRTGTVDAVVDRASHWFLDDPASAN
jgi:hypothetical protein